ncbi:hypothetical protein [Frankia sp. Cr2]|uniref:hypothetical protein n=1 Tax=Frankia sp. Cr2 TaxID=3073932 RepID=UPI002AD24FFB|nr:hypothetical protein [Frankia sp. Cr2]
MAESALGAYPGLDRDDGELLGEGLQWHVKVGQLLAPLDRQPPREALRALVQVLGARN